MKEVEEEGKQQQSMTRRRVPPALPGSHPLLVFFHGKHGQSQTFYSISEDRYHVKSIPGLRWKQLWACYHGWWLLHDYYTDDCFLLNPISMDKIQLPTWEKPIYYDLCVLSSPPSDPRCTALFIFNSRLDRGMVSFIFCSPVGGDHWIEQEMKLEDIIENATCCDGKIYAVSLFIGAVFIIEVVDTNTIRVSKMRLGGKFPSSFFPFEQVMIESCGDLYVVSMIYAEELEHDQIHDIEVFKVVVDHSSSSSRNGCWERVKSIGDRAFFLSLRPRCRTSYSIIKFDDGESGGLGLITRNTIYYTMREDRSLYAFNLEDRSITVSLPCPNVKHHWSQPIWVLPS